MSERYPGTLVVRCTQPGPDDIVGVTGGGDIVALRWVVRDTGNPTRVLQSGVRRIVQRSGDGRIESTIQWQDVPTESET